MIPPTRPYRDFLLKSLQNKEECIAYLNAFPEDEELIYIELAIKDIVDAQIIKRSKKK